jgi:hypothetical protein
VQLAHGGSLASVVNGGGIPDLEQQGFGAGLSVTAEERPHVALQRLRQLCQSGPLAEARQGEIHQNIFAAALANGLPGFRAGETLHKREGALQRPETLH